jgi:hypothetical protein
MELVVVVNMGNISELSLLADYLNINGISVP